MSQVGLSLFNYQDDARSDKLKTLPRILSATRYFRFMLSPQNTYNTYWNRKTTEKPVLP